MRTDRAEVRPLLQWVSYWKSISARRWPRPEEAPVWQRHFWDTQLRRGESYEEKWQYVRENPVRAGLVTDTHDWPYQGVLNELRW
jgi:putative transposase